MGLVNTGTINANQTTQLFIDVREPSHVIPVRGVLVGVHEPPMQTIRIMKPVLPRMR
jgi:hypothetical protein